MVIIKNEEAFLRCKQVFVTNKSVRTCRGKEGGSGREYNLVRLISIVSSSGTFVNGQQTSKEHIDFIIVLMSLQPVHKSEGVLDCELVRP